MNILTKSSLMMAISLASPSAIAQSGHVANAAGTDQVTVENGIASFYVSTNVPAIEVSGKSGALQARVQIHRDGNGITLEQIEAWMPVKTLNTGLGLRDDHMRKHIFTTAGGEVPDLRFEGGEVDCPGVAPGHEATCLIVGTLAIRGVPRSFSIPLKVRHESNGTSLRATGDGLVRLSDYGIERPTQLGVKTSNEVKIHLELIAKEGPAMSAAVRRPQ